MSTPYFNSFLEALRRRQQGAASTAPDRSRGFFPAFDQELQRQQQLRAAGVVTATGESPYQREIRTGDGLVDERVPPPDLRFPSDINQGPLIQNQDFEEAYRRYKNMRMAMEQEEEEIQI